MKKVLSILILILVCSIGNIAYAQKDNTGLTDEQKKILRERVLQKTEEFFSSLNKMVDNTQSHNTRVHHQNQLLNLFMGKGGPYDISNEIGISEHSDGVKMWTSSVNNPIKSHMLLRNYVKRLYDPRTGKPRMQYTNIKIESADAVRVDNIEREGNNYVCVAYFYQDFYGIIDGKIIYKDRTCKKIKCYINAIDVPGIGKVFDAKLADITVVSTERI